MSPGPEQKFWHLIKDHVPGHVNRIENSVAVGIPDVNYCYEGTEAWIELKAEASLPSVVGNMVDSPKCLRPSQLQWHMRRVMEGGKVMLATRDGDTIKLYQCIHMKRYICLLVETKPWNWGNIESVLKGW